VLQQPQSVDLHQRILAALAGEDRAALSGRPRKANAVQYKRVMPQRRPVRNRDAATQPRTNSFHRIPDAVSRRGSLRE
jgi:hypothetical protein